MAWIQVSSLIDTEMPKTSFLRLVLPFRGFPNDPLFSHYAMGRGTVYSASLPKSAPLPFSFPNNVSTDTL